MKLQILINHYHESEELAKRMLQSIERQDYSKDDFEVLIGNDGEDCRLPENFLWQFSFSLRQFCFEHRGVCATRNSLLDLATAQYVMFCDIDDEFFGANGLSILLKTAEETQADVVRSAYLSERKHSRIHEGYIRMIIPNDQMLVHGKLFRRSYLIQNGIRFPDELPKCGDMGFIWETLHLSERVVRIQDLFYIWKYVDNSVSREDPYFHERTYPFFVRAYSLSAEHLLQLGRKDLAQDLIAMLFHLFYLNSRSEWLEKMQKDISETALNAEENCIRQYYSIYDEISEPDRKVNYENYILFRRKDVRDYPFDGFLQWIENYKHEEVMKS